MNQVEIGELRDDGVGPGCRAFDPLIAVLGTPALSAEDDARTRAHLGDCARCRDLAQLFGSDAEDSLGSDAEDSLGSDAEDSLAASGAAAPTPNRLVAGALVAGRYRLEHLLGRGGMGVVWAATQTATGQAVAVKLLRAEGAGERARRRLLREARAACAVRHPGVVRILDVVELDDGSPALVMELLSGRTLQRVFDGGPVPLPELCHVLGRVAAALGAVHAAGVVHRDLKPDNIFLSRGGGGAIEVKLLDFGIARRTAIEPDLATGTLTRTGALVGTPFYMSPEQALGEDDVDARADLWALGLLLYQGLSGALPSRGDNLGQVIKAIALTPFEPLERLVPGLPADVADLAARLLAKPRQDRPGLDEALAVLERHESASLDALAWTPDGDGPPSGRAKRGKTNRRGAEAAGARGEDASRPLRLGGSNPAPSRAAGSRRIAPIAAIGALVLGACVALAALAARAPQASPRSPGEPRAEAPRREPDAPAPATAGPSAERASEAPAPSPKATARASAARQAKAPHASAPRPEGPPGAASSAAGPAQGIGVEREF